MLSFVQNWLAPRCNPIGVDFGSDCLRLAQVQWAGDEYRLLAAASADVPSHVRNNPAARLDFFVTTVRDLLAQAPFKGRQAVLALPASSMFIQHLRMPKLDEDALKKALPWELRGKIPVDPSQALLRHLVAGDVFQDQDPKSEVIVMAAARETVNQLLAQASRAKLDVVGMNVEPMALVDCFAHVYRRKADADVTVCFVDIGCVATRAVVARGGQIFFARAIPIGGDHFTRAVAEAMKVGFEDAKTLRIKLCHAQQQAVADEQQREKQTAEAAVGTTLPATPDAEAEDNSFALLGAGMAASSKKQSGGERRGSSAAPASPPQAQSSGAAPGDELTKQLRQVEQACLEPLRRLVSELDLCRRYYEATFPAKPVERLIFVGGEARQRGLCMHVAREMGLAAQVGDPLVRMGRISEIGIETGIDRRYPQPTWAVAIGLSMGPPAVAGKNAKGTQAA